MAKLIKPEFAHSKPILVSIIAILSYCQDTRHPPAGASHRAVPRDLFRVGSSFGELACTASPGRNGGRSQEAASALNPVMRCGRQNGGGRRGARSKRPIGAAPRGVEDDRGGAPAEHDQEQRDQVAARSRVQPGAREHLGLDPLPRLQGREGGGHIADAQHVARAVGEPFARSALNYRSAPHIM